MDALARCLCICLLLGIPTSETSDSSEQANGSYASDEVFLLQEQVQAQNLKSSVGITDEVSMLQQQLQVQMNTESDAGKHNGHDRGKQDLHASSTDKDSTRDFKLQGPRYKNIWHRLAFRSHHLLSIGRPWIKYLLPTLVIGLLLELILLGKYIYANKDNKPVAHDPKVAAYLACVGISFFLVSIFYLVWIISLNYRVEFIHIPKNAGTAIEKAGWEAGIGWGKHIWGLTSKQPMPDGRNICSAYHVPHHLSGAQLQFKDYTAVCVTRHPFARMVSEYVYLLSDDLQIESAGHAWGRRYDSLYGTEMFRYPPCTFQGFNHWVQKTLEIYMQGNRYVNDCHHIPQVEYIWDPSGVQQCSDIIRIDDLPDAFNAVMAREGYAVRLGHHKANSADQRCTNVSISSLDNKSRAMLIEIYAEDFKRLNYSIDVVE